MSKPAVGEPIGNATEIIAAFGGIRPMSAKINVAVTTIQGWKKRDAIPANRKKVILKSAAEHHIDLSSFFDDAPKIESNNDNEVSETEVEEVVAVDEAEVEAVTETPSEDNNTSVVEEDEAEEVETFSEESSEDDDKANVYKEDEFRPLPRQTVTHKDFTEIAVTTERRAITKSTMIAAAMVLIILGAIIVMLLPKYEAIDHQGERLASLEGEVTDLRQQQLSFKGLVPENWSEQLAELKQQAAQAQQMATQTMQTVKNASNDLMHGKIEDRVEKLQTYVSEITGEERLYGLVKRFDGMRESYSGLNITNESMAMLSNVFTQADGKDDQHLNAMIDVARQKSPSLAKTMEGVPQNELKAAAMLLALTQVRSSLNRGEDDFEGDLDLLMNMVNEDDTELRTSLQKLAPTAKTGILSLGGLKSEFQTVAGDVVASSLRGEEVSLTEKMSAKMNDILKVEKNGELVTGTETQATVDKAQKMVEKGQIEEALRFLKKQLKSKELEPLRPWIKEAEKFLNKREVQKMIDQAIELSTGRGYLGGSKLIDE